MERNHVVIIPSRRTHISGIFLIWPLMLSLYTLVSISPSMKTDELDRIKRIYERQVKQKKDGVKHSVLFILLDKNYHIPLDNLLDGICPKCFNVDNNSMPLSWPGQVNLCFRNSAKQHSKLVLSEIGTLHKILLTYFSRHTKWTAFLQISLFQSSMKN